ncbi:MAG: hypothetical protein QE285_06810 [Aquabacterium sp.]|nr:hypothetical protein [Aquabacterium sp.]
MQTSSASLPGQFARPGRPAHAACAVAPLTIARRHATAQATHGLLHLSEHDGLISPPQRSASSYRHCPQDAAEQIDARRARQALLRSELEPVAGGNFSAVHDDAAGRFPVDGLAAAAATQESGTWARRAVQRESYAVRSTKAPQ